MQLGDRMKRYEQAFDQALPARLPVILRLDGNSFSRLTSREAFDKPFDDVFAETMDAAAVAVLEYCSGAQVAYSQSDEISILLRNDQSNDTEPFLANRIQKLTSLCAAKASVAFNRELSANGTDTEAVFDCRAFVLPPHEVNNYFLWRQRDCFKNCISTFAYWGLRNEYGRKQAHSKLHGLSTDERQELIFQELGVNPNDIDTRFKRGVCVFRERYETELRETLDPEKLDRLLEQGHVDSPEEPVIRSRWVVDEEIPRFGKDQTYINSFLEQGEDTDED